MRATRLVLIVVLVGFALYSVSVLVRASFFTNRHGPVFWMSIGLIALLAIAAVWGAARLRGHS